MENNKKDKLSRLLIYIINKAKKIPKVKLAKLVLFSEIEYFNRTNTSITGLYFVRLRNGPVISFFNEVLESKMGKFWNEEKKDIPIYEEGIIKKQHLYTPIVEDDMSDKDVKAAVDRAIQKYGRKSGTELSRLSHCLPAWLHSEPNEPISIAELAVKNEKEYFALIDIMEDVDDNNAVLEKKISQSLSQR